MFDFIDDNGPDDELEALEQARREAEQRYAFRANGDEE